MIKNRLKHLIKLIIRIPLKIIFNKYILREFERIFWLYTDDKQKKLLTTLQSCGHGVHLNGIVHITDPRTVIIGNNVHIGNGSYFRSEGGLTIGDNTHISRNVCIYTQSYEYEGKALPYDEKQRLKPVAIGKNVWIGMNVSIIPGIRIGEGAVIGMGTPVTSNVPPFAVIGASPFRKIKHRNIMLYNCLDNNEKYSGVNGEPLGQEDLQKFHRHLNENAENIFFLVSTGRSGTTSLAKILSMHPDIYCMHEGRQQLIRLSTEYAHGEKKIDKVESELKDIYYNINITSSIFGESNQKLFNLIEVINKILPKAKFIWLIRDGRSFVASSYSRGWYSEKEYAECRQTSKDIRPWFFYRLEGDKCNDVDAHLWKEFNALEKNCWYWSYVNKVIEKNLNNIDENLYIKIKLEELKSNIPKILSFLEVDKFDIKPIKANKRKQKVLQWRSWDTVMKYKFENICGDIMNKHYPNWRNN